MELKQWFYIYCSLATMIIIFVAFFPIYQFYVTKHNFIKKCYKDIYPYILDKDFLMINSFYFPNSGYKKQLCDHIIFGKKYIYFVYDFYLFGAINGNANDKTWIFYPYKDKPTYFANPKELCKARVEYLCKMFRIDRDLTKTIVLFSDSVKIELDKYQVDDLCYINKKDFQKTIKDFENTNIENINQKVILEMAQKINGRNQRDLLKKREKFWYKYLKKTSRKLLKIIQSY